jgi:hypothetical protein
MLITVTTLVTAFALFCTTLASRDVGFDGLGASPAQPRLGFGCEQRKVAVRAPAY